MNLDLQTEKCKAFVRIMAAPHGLECECLALFFENLLAGSDADCAAYDALWEWDIPTETTRDELLARKNKAGA